VTQVPTLTRSAIPPMSTTTATLDALRSGALKGITRLDLSCGLEEFPREIFELADTLEVLNLSGNLLSELPDDLPRLGKLRVIFCSENRFTQLPEVLASCAQLEMVGFKANAIQEVAPAALSPGWRWLILTDNQISELPDAIGSMRGFWANLDQATVVQATGASAPAGNFSIDLTPGWHQLANPFFAPLDFSKTTVTVASNTMDLASAQNANIIRALAWTYATEDNEYRLAYPTVPSQPASLIAPWAGFWALILQPCTLTLARPSGTATASDIGTPAATKTASADWPGRWQAQVVLRASGASVDTQNYIGIADKDYLIPSPPAIGNNPQLHLSRANCSHDETAPLAVSLANSAAARWTWDLDVTNLAPGTAAEIAMPDLSSLPADYIITLHDPLTGASTFLRTASEYRFVSRSAGSRAFQLPVRERRPPRWLSTP